MNQLVMHANQASSALGGNLLASNGLFTQSQQQDAAPPQVSHAMYAVSSADAKTTAIHGIPPTTNSGSAIPIASATLTPTFPPPQAISDGEGPAASSLMHPGAPAASTQSTDNPIITNASQQAFTQGTPKPPRAAVIDPAKENEERRARRLARNRESARQSRRRKKENLAFLGGKVNRLHMEIEEERKKQLESMEKGLIDRKRKGISELKVNNAGAGGKNAVSQPDDTLKKQLRDLFNATGPNSVQRRCAVSFQYSTLRQLLLPTFHQFFLWLSFVPHSFFSEGKEMRSKMTSRVSSKQIGEEITTAHNCDAEGGKANGKQTGKPLSCSSSNAATFWPLVCFELGMSAEQEDKFVNAHRRIKETVNLATDRARLHAASSMSSNLKKGILSHCHSVSHKTETSLLHILTPEQSARFSKWFVLNKDRCRSIANMDKEKQNFSGETSLNELCVQLDQSLNIHQHLKRPAFEK